MLKQMFLVLCLMGTSISNAADHGPGGGPDAAVRKGLRDVIENPMFTLKEAMIDYLKSIDDQAASLDPNGQWIVDNKAVIIDHIKHSPFVVRQNSVEGYCNNTKRPAPAASTQFESDWAPIYFDLDALYPQIKDDDEGLQKFKIEITAFHEIRHQLQKAPVQDSSCTPELARLEDQAIDLAGYLYANKMKSSIYLWSNGKNTSAVLTDQQLKDLWCQVWRIEETGAFMGNFGNNTYNDKATLDPLIDSTIDQINATSPSTLNLAATLLGNVKKCPLVNESTLKILDWKKISLYHKGRWDILPGQYAYKSECISNILVQTMRTIEALEKDTSLPLYACGSRR